MNEIIFLVGLTAVGKTSSVNALTQNSYKLLPNRRALTDMIIIPKVQKESGLAKEPVTDRTKRFEITAKYRQSHPAGIVSALKDYLKNQENGNYIFDNIRGKNELEAAVGNFNNSRFVFLDAPYKVRLQRLIKRNDDFDFVTNTAAENDLLRNLENIEKANELFDLEHLATLGHERESLISAVRIIAAEYKNYNSETAKEFLFSLDKQKYVYIDTSKNNIDQVSIIIERFLHG